MKHFGALRLVKKITHYVGRSAVLIGFAWAGHAQAMMKECSEMMK